MKLWQFEMKKMLFTQNGLLVLALCILLKSVGIAVIPELKDERIKLSQKQYDRYLSALYGENTPDKVEYIIAEYENCKATQEARTVMEQAYQRGTLSEEEWKTYCEKLNRAYINENALRIFLEKEEQFAIQDEALAPAHYIYEYGWKTVFTVSLFPDIFLLFGVLLITAQCFASESAGGMLYVLLSARNGRQYLYWVKLSVLLIVCGSAFLFDGLSEVLLFCLRGFLKDGSAPLYSLTLFAEKCPLQMSLLQGYLLSLAVRGMAVIFFAMMCFGIAVWQKSATNLIFLGLCILTVPLLLPGSAFLLFTHSGLLTGSRMLMILGETGLRTPLPVGIVCAYSAAILWAGQKRYQKGL